ncbi:hypothetical protein NLQ81_25475, partial [Escherichia coli]|nr:hypothetical protein [Escherichia coli]
MGKNEILLAWRSAGSKRYANPDPKKWESAARQTAEDHAPHGIDVLIGAWPTGTGLSRAPVFSRPALQTARVL